MKHPSWLIVGLLCGTAVAQQSQTPQPISVGIVFDASGSMGRKLHQARRLVAEFVKTANPQDEFFLVKFGDDAVLAAGLGSPADEIQTRLFDVQAKGRSALFDAIDLALREIEKARNLRKAVLVISDGGDNSSRSTIAELRALAQQSNVRIYSIGIYEPFPYGDRTAEELSGPRQLNEIAELSGGRHFAVERSEELPNVVPEVRTALLQRQ
jgi:Ca-activated chloride channel family protein